MSILKWTKKSEWGGVGLTHRTSITLRGCEYAFCVDQPSKGHWVARGWRDGDFCMYREAKTLADAKREVALRVGELKGASQ